MAKSIGAPETRSAPSCWSLRRVLRLPRHLIMQATRPRSPGDRVTPAAGSAPCVSPGTRLPLPARPGPGRGRRRPASQLHGPPPVTRRPACARASAVTTRRRLERCPRPGCGPGSARRRGGRRPDERSAGARPECLLGVEDAARIDPLSRLADADDAGQEPARAGLGNQAAPGEDEADAGVVSRNPDIHRKRHRGADAYGRPVDGADHRFEAVEDPADHQASGVDIGCRVVFAACRG